MVVVVVVVVVIQLGRYGMVYGRYDLTARTVHIITTTGGIDNHLGRRL